MPIISKDFTFTLQKSQNHHKMEFSLVFNPLKAGLDIGAQRPGGGGFRPPQKPLLRVVPIDFPTKVDATIKFLGLNFHF